MRVYNFYKLHTTVDV